MGGQNFHFCLNSEKWDSPISALGTMWCRRKKRYEGGWTPSGMGTGVDLQEGGEKEGPLGLVGSPEGMGA